MKCPHCNEAHPDDAKFCTRTGKLLDHISSIGESSINVCPRCSKPIANGLVFCTWCGANLADFNQNGGKFTNSQVEQSKNSDYVPFSLDESVINTSRESSRNKKIVYIMIPIIILFGAVLLLSLLGVLPLNQIFSNIRSFVFGQTNVEMVESTSTISVANNLTATTEVIFEEKTPTLDPIGSSNASVTPPTVTPSETLPQPTETIVYQLGDTIQSTRDGMTQIFIPDGVFVMGSNEGEWSPDEEPERVVYLNAYFIDKTEVTNHMYMMCVEEGSCTPPQDYTSKTHSPYYGNIQYDDYPVVNINWAQANTYCKWAGRRLPTEAEWEKAARGEDGNIFPWGDYFSCKNGNFDDETQFDDYTVEGGEGCDGFIEIAPAGSFLSGASPYKVLDMSGNVWEWVADKYDSNYYYEQPSENPLGPEKGSNRVMRGGSWDNNAPNIRAANRLSNDPNSYFNNAGFRCAYTP